MYIYVYIYIVGDEMKLVDGEIGVASRSVKNTIRKLMEISKPQGKDPRPPPNPLPVTPKP